MQERFHTLINVLQHNPLAVLAFLLIGVSSALYMYIQLKMIRAGYVSSYSFLKYTLGWFGQDVPPNYFEIGKKHGWSLWPAFLMWPCFFVGLILLLIAFLVL